MTDMQIDIDGWPKWLEEHRAIRSKLRGSNIANKEAYFLIIHAATEAMFRRILLVGLRLNKVTYREANEWLYHNDDTPERVNFPKLFDRLYNSKQITWSALICSDPDLEQLWELWLGYSKVVRNHISHGIRKYTDDWLQCGVIIDQELLVRLNYALLKTIGGSICADLAKLSPRLPVGAKGSDLRTITNRKLRNPKPSISLVNAKNTIEGLTSSYSMI